MRYICIRYDLQHWLIKLSSFKIAIVGIKVNSLWMEFLQPMPMVIRSSCWIIYSFSKRTFLRISTSGSFVKNICSLIHHCLTLCISLVIQNVRLLVLCIKEVLTQLALIVIFIWWCWFFYHIWWCNQSAIISDNSYTLGNFTLAPGATVSISHVLKHIHVSSFHISFCLNYNLSQYISLCLSCDARFSCG